MAVCFVFAFQGSLIVNRTMIFFASVCVSMAVIPVLAEEAAKTRPASDSPVILPVGEPGVLATVGEVKITYEQIRNILEKLPYKPSRIKRRQLRGKYLQEILMAELTHAFLKHHKVGYLEQDLAMIKEQFDKMAERHNKLSEITRRPKVTPRDLMEARGLTEERLRDQARYKRLFNELLNEEAIEAFIKANPNFFDGTQVQVKHILIACSSLAPTNIQKAAITKLEKIRADILGGKITFEEAASKYSDDPPKTGGDDLVMFTFPQLLPSLGMAAFSTKEGEMSGVIRTNFGFYLLKITKRIEGSAEPGSHAVTIAVRTLRSQLNNKIFDQTLTTMPIVIYRKSPKP